MRFYIFTADHSGLPLAGRLQSEGADTTLVMIEPEIWETDKAKIEKRKQYLIKNGSGLLRKMWARDAVKEISKRPSDCIVIFDQIYGWQYGRPLREMGAKVLGGTEFGYRLETERELAMEWFKRLGMDVPDRRSFPRGAARRAAEFLRKTESPLYVLKSDSPKVLVAVAQDSNEELVQKIETEFDQINSDNLILQQKVEGVELAVETWYHEGEPVLASVDIEMKRKYNEMCEVQTGCSADLVWAIPVEHSLRRRVNGPYDGFAESVGWTGLLDASVIYDHREDKMWVLECCGGRFGYNSLYTLLATLYEWSVADFFTAYLGGVRLERAFKGYGASLRVFNDESQADVVMDYPCPPFYEWWPWDCHMERGKMLTVGGSDSVGILTACGENPESALAQLRERFNRLVMPTKWARDDFDEEDSPGLILSRFHTLKRLGQLVGD